MCFYIVYPATAQLSDISKHNIFLVIFKIVPYQVRAYTVTVSYHSLFMIQIPELFLVSDLI